MKQVTIPENTFSFTDDELRVLHAIVYYHACDTDDMIPKAGNIVDRLNKQFQKMQLESEMEVR